MKKPPLVVVDADAIIAQAHQTDANHRKSTEISKKLIQLHAQIIYPVTAVTEAITVIQRVLGSGPMAYETATLFTELNVGIVEISQDIYSHAVNNYFSPNTSKKNTLFDCIVASVAEKYQADAIFSFDKFYRKCGFKLASEL